MNQKDEVELLTTAVRHGNAQEVAAMFMSSVDMTMDNAENLYSAQQAELVLADFFKRNPPKTAQVLHRITSSSSYHLIVLIVSTPSGSYRLAFSLKNNAGKFMISELRIEPEKSK